MTVATATAVEMVRFAPENPRGRVMFDALKAAAPAAGISLSDSTEYRGSAPWLLLWGPGNPVRAEALRRHVSAGGRVLAFDLAYWDRDHKVRVSIDAAHPQQIVMSRTWPTDRIEQAWPGTSIAWNPDGPIVIAGLGQKARVQYGAARVDEWEADMMRACAARWARPILYRRKKADAGLPTWATREATGPIEDALKGASLVITWHSNVAVDALRMGIPVVCRDGAAAAVCPSELGDRHWPIALDVRDRFLSNLAWFQWAPSEAAAFWAWALEVLA